MKSGDFEVCIANGLEAPDTGRVELRHGAVYQIALTNHSDERCKASLVIDGREMGEWIIDAHSDCILERPRNHEGRFTFFRAGSSEAVSIALPDARESGIVAVWFIPEIWVSARSAKEPFEFEDERDDDPDSGGTPGSNPLYAASPLRANRDDEENDAAGVTGFTGKSEQVHPIEAESWRAQWDTERAILIELRLLAEPEPKPEPVRAAARKPDSAPFPTTTVYERGRANPLAIGAAFALSIITTAVLADMHRAGVDEAAAYSAHIERQNQSWNLAVVTWPSLKDPNSPIFGEFKRLQAARPDRGDDYPYAFAKLAADNVAASDAALRDLASTPEPSPKQIPGLPAIDHRGITRERPFKIANLAEPSPGEVASWTKILRLYPDLTNPRSALRITLEKRVKEVLKVRPDFFRFADWPESLVPQCANLVQEENEQKQRPSAQSVYPTPR